MKKPSKNLAVHLESIDAKIAELQNQQTRMNARISAIDAEISSGKLNVGDLLREKKALNDELPLIADELEILTQQRTNLEQAIANDGKEARRAELAAIVAQTENSIVEWQGRINRLSDELRSEIQRFYTEVYPGCTAYYELQQLADDFNPYNPSMASLLAHKGKITLPRLSPGGMSHQKFVLVHHDAYLSAPLPQAEDQ